MIHYKCASEKKTMCTLRTKKHMQIIELFASSKKSNFMIISYLFYTVMHSQNFYTMKVNWSNSLNVISIMDRNMELV